MTACGADSPKTFEAEGKIETPTRKNIQCNSQNVNALKAGKEVKIQANGNTVAIGQVTGTPSFEDSSPHSGYICIYDFIVSDVPAGEKFYTLVIEDEGDKEVTEAQLQDGSLVLVTHELDNMPK